MFPNVYKRALENGLMCTRVGVLRQRVGVAFELWSVVPMTATFSHEKELFSTLKCQNAKFSRCAGLEREVCYAPPTLDVLPISGRTSPSVSAARSAPEFFSPTIRSRVASVGVPASCSRLVGSCCIAARGVASREVVEPAVARRSAFLSGAAISQPTVAVPRVAGVAEHVDHKALAPGLSSYGL